MKNKIHANRSESRVKWLSVVLATLLVMFGLPTTIPTDLVYASPLFWTQTTYDDFNIGSQKHQVSVVDIGSGDGDIKLEQKTLMTEVKNWPTPTENVTSYPRAIIYGTCWVAQTFTANASGRADIIALYLSRNGIPGDLVVELRNTRGSSYEPGDTILTSATIPSSQVTVCPGACEVIFPTQPPLTNGTVYAIVLHQLGNAGSIQNNYYWYCDCTPGYDHGSIWANGEGNGSGEWTRCCYCDLCFIVNILTTEVQYYTSGYLVSSAHNTGCYALFDSISWNADAPPDTTLKFQIATNNDNSTWNFLGPDGTNGTFYTTNGSAIWSGHDGNQYIKYKSYFQTSDTSVTPILHDISITYEQYGEASRLELEPPVASNVVGTDHILTATVYDQYDNPVPNQTVTWTIESGPSSFTSTETTTDTNGQAQAVITSTTTGITTVKAAVSETVYNTATKTWTADELYQFVFDTIPSPQTAGVAFSINITATDQFGNTVTSYTGLANLTDLSATISPTVTGNFANGVWTGDVAITASYTDDNITATDTINNSVNGTSNQFDVISGLPPTIDHIIISPDTATIIAGATQTYTAAAYDQSNNWLADVTQSTAFSIDAGAGGNWSNNIYTSQNPGSWTVTGNLTLFNMTDTASLTVSQAGPGPGPGPEPEPEPEPQYNGIYFVVDFLGKITQEKMSIDGSLLNPLKAPSPDGVHLLEMEEGTRTLDDKDEIVTLIEIREAETPELPPDTSVVGNAYDFKPPDITFDKSIILTLGYDVNDLPENVESVVLAYYTLKSGWVELETKKSGVVAEVGTISAPVSHFTIFAVLAKTTPLPPVTSVPVLPPPATFKLSNLSIMPSWSKVWEIPTFVVRIGEEATISVEVTNHGGQKGSYTTILKINGIPRETKDISLNPGQTEKVSFIIADNEPGIYVVSIGDLSGEFVSILWINWWLIGGLIVVFVLICWLVWYYYKKKRQMPVNY